MTIMNHAKHSPVLNLTLILIMFLSLMNISAGRYDGETPTDPPATEEVTDPPVEETETPPDASETETPEETEQLVDGAEPTSEETGTRSETSTSEDEGTEPVSTETPTEETVVDPVATESPESADEANTAEDENAVPPAMEEPTPAPDEEAEIPPTEESTEEETPLEPLLSELPENTNVVILDEAGNSVPLVTTEAKDIVQVADPMWCPAGSLPGDAGCVAHATISSLITDITNNPGNYNADAIIYFEKPAGGFTDSFELSETSLGNTAYDIIKNNELTLQGGLNGTGTTTVTGRTTFDGTAGAFILIGSSSNPWIGNISISRFTINGNGSSTDNSLTVYTTSGDIALENININGQGGDGYTAYLESDSGDISVTSSVSSDNLFDGYNPPGNTNKGFSAKTNSGSIEVSDTIFQDAAGTNNNGASLSAPIVTLTNVIAQDNDGNGIRISNANQVTLNNVTAAPDSASQSNGLSGVYVDGTGSTIVNILGGSFNQNSRYGVEVTGSILNEVSAPTCANNGLGTLSNPCYNVTPNSPPTISMSDVTVEGNTVGGWTLVFNTIGSASDLEDGTPSISCSPAIGTTLAVGTTTSVTCTAIDSGLLTAGDSGNITVQDTTPPVIAAHADVTVGAISAAGAAVNYTSPSTTDAVDGSGTAACTPASGSIFPTGTTTVTCTAIDLNGNAAAPISFDVLVENYVSPRTKSPGFQTPVIPVTGGTPFDVSCFGPVTNMLNPPGVRVTFINLCGDQAVMDNLEETDLPGELPEGLSFINGFSVLIQKENTFLQAFPANAQLLINLVIPASMRDADLAVIVWDGSKWVEIPGQVVNDYIELVSTQGGIFILVSK